MTSDRSSTVSDVDVETVNPAEITRGICDHLRGRSLITFEDGEGSAEKHSSDDMAPEEAVV